MSEGRGYVFVFYHRWYLWKNRKCGCREETRFKICNLHLLAVTSGNLGFNLSESQFPYLVNEDDNSIIFQGYESNKNI